MDETEHRPTWKTLSAFAIIYLVWGSTFLAIRIGVLAMPPLLFAAMRFLVAGAALFGWMVARGEPLPKGRQWLSASLLALMIFVIDYGLLFWAEQRVPSGIAAVIMATIPAFIALSEILLLKTQRLTVSLGAALLVGIGGVAILMSHGLNLGGAPVDKAGAAAIIIASLSWSIASVISRRLDLPHSKGMSAGTQMLLGGIFLSFAAFVSGEVHGFQLGNVSITAWLSLVYLIVFGSLLGFTCYVWLIHHESPTKVGTYAYVNPVVAVLIGYFFGGESLDLRTILGTALILASVVVITTAPAKKPVPILAAEEG
ncbi:MAG TPA: EamA family transporter [Terracidiphilus sp.]|nr:EamA family transporter [Terracidiphilus sp.]